MIRSSFDYYLGPEETSVNVVYDSDINDVSIVEIRIYQQDGRLSANIFDLGFEIDPTIEDELIDYAIEIEMERINGNG